jgi:hypothetical protein
VSEIPQPPARRHRPWDAYRRISAWAGLLEAVAAILLLLTLGDRLAGDEQDDSTTATIILFLAAPAVLAGLVSGSRFFALYAGYAERLDPTAALSPADAARGGDAASSYIGDGMWGSLIAGCAGGVPATVAFSSLFGPFAVIALPIFVLVVGLTWFTGWVIGALASLILSTAIGIAVGVGRRDRPTHRLPFILVAIFLPVLLVAVAVPAIGVRVADGRLDVWGAIHPAAGVPMEGAAFTLGDPVLWIVRLAIWVAVVLFAALVVAGTPALLRRRAAKGTGDEAAS